MNRPAAHTRVEAGNPEYFPFLSAERMVGIAAVGFLVTLVFYVYARGFISLSADEFAKAVAAWDGPRTWFSLIWLPGHFPLIRMAYIVIGDLLTASRFVSILGGVVVVFGVYRLSRQMGAIWAGGIAAMLCATHPLVVLLSATGLVDIVYTGPFILGLSYYVQRPLALSQFYVACTLFAVSCAFHHNAWLAVVPVGAAISFDFILGQRNNRLNLFVGLCIIALVPVAWCTWNLLQYGSPLSFLQGHVEESTRDYQRWGAAAPSLKGSVYWIKETILQYSPILVGLTITSIAGLLIVTERKEALILTWAVLSVFVAGLIVLFTYGGLSTAYPERSLLSPSLLMAVLSAHTLARLILNQDRYVRVFTGLLLGIALAANLTWLRHLLLVDGKIQEAAIIAEALRKEQRPGKILLEVKPLILNALRVFLNSPPMIIGDMGAKKPENSILMQPEEAIRRFAQENGIDRIAVWSDSVRSHVKELGLQALDDAGSYTIYSLD